MPMSKCRERPWNLYKYKNYFFKKAYFSLIIEYGMYLKCLQKPRCLGWFKTSQAKTRLNSAKDNFIAKSFCLSTKRTLSILLNFLFPFVPFISVLSSLKCKPLAVENHHIMNARQPFCWWMTFTKVSNPFLPSPPKWLTWPLDVFEGVAGMGDFIDLDCIGRILSQTSLKLEIFPPTYNSVRFFFSTIRHERYFFQCRIFFSQKFICMLFPLEISLQDIFSEITHNPLKSQMVGP